MLVISVLALLCGLASGQAPTSMCQDLDTSACSLFSQAKPDLCNDPSFANSTCIRFCGNCPLECFSCPSPVLDPDDCNTTETCSLGSTCMTKHLLAADGHHEYIMTCERKDVCAGLNFGFGSIAVGKRNTEEDEFDEEIERTARDVSLSCCDTDFCNFPGKSTTPMPVTYPTTVPLSISGCNRDIIFAVDDSGSVGMTNFNTALQFVRQIITALDIGPHNAQVALMAFSSHPQIEWHLNKYPTKAQSLNALGTVRYQSGVTRTADALEAIRTQMFTYQHGDRSSANNVVIVLTDGQSNDKVDTAHEANNLHAVSHDVISVVIGRGVNLNELNNIATDNNHVIDVRGYSDLSGIIPHLLDLICRT